MIGALDVLVVDDRPESVRFLTEFLLQRCRRVDVATSVKEAEAAIARRRAANESYHLIFCDFVMPGVDGMALLRQLRQHHDEVPFVFITGFRSLNPAFETEAQRLGVLAILDKPLELQEVGRLLDAATVAYRRKREAQAADQPFFGTSRVFRGHPPPAAPQAAAPPSMPEEVREPLPEAAAGGFQPDDFEPASSALEPRGGAQPGDPYAALDPRQLAPNDPRLTTPVQGYQRRPSNIIAMPGSSTRVRRSVDPPIVRTPPPGAAPPAPPPPQAAPQPPQRGSEPIRRPGLPSAPPAAAPPTARIPSPLPQTTMTTRVRRGLDAGPPAAAPPAAAPVPDPTVRLVTCERCGKAFAAPLKPVAYTTVCIHCGHLQRVEPG